MVKIYLTALKSHHVDHGLSIDVFDDQRIKRIIPDSLHVFEVKPIRERSEIIRDILLSMIFILSNYHDDINLKAVFIIAFTAFLRPSEFT